MADNSTYTAVMKKTRLRRKLFFGTVLAYLPAIIITHMISPTTMAMGTVFGIWVVLLIIATVFVALCICPACGNYFHMHGMTLLVLRKCLHCQLHINTDTPPPIETARTEKIISPE
jgi:hypothetical protein